MCSSGTYLVSGIVLHDVRPDSDHILSRCLTFDAGYAHAGVAHELGHVSGVLELS